MVVAPKMDGELQFFVTYRKLNLETVADTYPLPLREDFIEILGDAAFFLHWTTNVVTGRYPFLNQIVTRPASQLTVARIATVACLSDCGTLW